MEENPIPLPSITQLVLTFRLHQVLHNILLALVKRELAWEVEAFFALHFNLLLIYGWRGVGGGLGGQKQTNKRNRRGFNEGTGQPCKKTWRETNETNDSHQIMEHEKRVNGWSWMEHRCEGDGRLQTASSIYPSYIYIIINYQLFIADLSSWNSNLTDKSCTGASLSPFSKSV